jgi:uncharacterized caspase-like protein
MLAEGDYVGGDRPFRDFCLGALAAAVLLFGGVPDAFSRTDKRVALVIGNGAYRHVSLLANPLNDANDVAESPGRLGFSVRRVTDGGYEDMRRALLDFNRSARGAEMAVVYFAGHGIEVGGENYLIPVDAELKSDIDVDHETVNLKVLMFSVASASQLGLVILDACRNNPFGAKMQRTIRTRSVSRGLAAVEPTGNVLVAFAAKEGTTAADGTGRNSPFTGSLLQHIETPGLEVNFLFRNVRDDVIRITNREQQPFVYGSLSKDAIYLKAPVANSDAMRRDYEFAAGIGTKEAWEFFLVAHPAGAYSDLARAALAKTIAEKAAAERIRQEAIEKEMQRVAEIEREKLAAAERARQAAADKARVEAENAQTKIAALPPDADRSEIARSLKAELNRVGCLSGEIDADWNDASRRALAKFGAQSGETFDPNTPSREALAAVKGKSARVCPLECRPGQQARGDRCIAIICPRGQALNAIGVCEPVKAAAKPEPKKPAREATPSRPSPAKSGLTRAPYPFACPQGDIAKCRANCAAGWQRACDFLTQRRL